MLAPLFPAVDNDVPEFDDPEFGDPEFDAPEFDDPEFEVLGVAARGAGVDAFGVPAVPGDGPQGEPLGVVPGVWGIVEFDPGALPCCPVLGVVPG